MRETEDESQTTRVLVVDASATMRGDDRGGSKIDYAIELVAQCARQASLASGDRLGLVAFDRRVVARVDPGDGPAHMRQVVAAAVELRALVDEDLTDVDEDQLLETVARYFREQEGVDVFRDASAADGRHKLARMVVSKAIEHDPLGAHPGGRARPRCTACGDRSVARGRFRCRSSTTPMGPRRLRDSRSRSGPRSSAPARRARCSW